MIGYRTFIWAGVQAVAGVAAITAWPADTGGWVALGTACAMAVLRLMTTTPAFKAL